MFNNGTRLRGVVSSTLRPFYPWTNSTRYSLDSASWVISRVSPEAVEIRKMFCSCWESIPVGQAQTQMLQTIDSSGLSHTQSLQTTDSSGLSHTQSLQTTDSSGLSHTQSLQTTDSSGLSYLCSSIMKLANLLTLAVQQIVKYRLSFISWRDFPHFTLNDGLLRVREKVANSPWRRNSV